VTLELGVTCDADFAKWVGFAFQTWRSDRRRDLIVEVCSEIGKVGPTYVLRRAWVTSFQGVPDLDANANAVSITTLTLNNEGQERH
jgi:phage tail-like protein